MNIFKEDCPYPIYTDIDTDRLYSLASGSPIGVDIAGHLLKVLERGYSLMNEFANGWLEKKMPRNRSSIKSNE